MADLNAIEIRGVTKFYGHGEARFAAVHSANFSIRQNEFFTLLGPSGCGKTTLLRLIAGFEIPQEGEILLNGDNIAGMPPFKRPINTVFQSYALFPHMTVAENVAFGLERLGKPKAEIKSRVAQMLGLVKLDGYGSRKASQLSGGQQQRVAVARALAPAPRVLLLDEPLSALDLKLRKEMQIELKRLQRETGVTFVLVTHDQEEALAMSDRIAVMRSGKVLQLGEPEAIYDKPRTRFVADFVGEANILPGKLAGSSAPFVAIRPERVALTSAETDLPGRVVSVTFLGSDTLYDVALNAGPMMRARLRQSVPGIGPGSAVHVAWPQDACRDVEDDQ